LWKLAKTGGYYARVKVSGKEKWKSLKTKLSSVAKLRLADFERAERQRAKAPEAAIELDGHTGGHFLDYYLAGVKLQDSASATISRTEIAAKALVKTWPEFRDLNVRNITALQCREWALRAKAKGTGFIAPKAKSKPRPMSSSAFNKTLSVLRAVLAIASKHGIIYSNPANEVARMPPKKKELILPSVGQFHAILHNIAEAGARQSRDCADMVAFLAYSGARLNEGLATSWGDVDEARGTIRIHGTKTTASDRVNPLFPALKKLLDGIKARRPRDSMESKILRTRECKASLANACAKAGVPRMTHHDLRHLFATRCIEAGVDIPTVSRWLGHADGGALAMRTYGHLRQDHSQAQAAKVTW
jgi:integrase